MKREIGVDVWMNKNGYGARLRINGIAIRSASRAKDGAEKIMEELTQTVRGVHGDFTRPEKRDEYIDVIGTLAELKKILNALEKMYALQFGE